MKLRRTSASSKSDSRAGGSNNSGANRDFVGFRERIERLVNTLTGLRHVPESRWHQGDKTEHVEVTLKADEFKVQFVVGQLSFETVTALVELFHRTFGGLAPLFAEIGVLGGVSFAKACHEDGGRYRQLFTGERTTLEFKPALSGTRHTVAVTSSFAGFDDHFEVFATDAARMLFPPVGKPQQARQENASDWYEDWGREFERSGCRVLRESDVGWSDLVGLDGVRGRLERAILLPLTRQELYAKVARAVMPGAATVLPRGVLLLGPPGTGKTWSMRAIASAAGVPVVSLSCDALMTKWYGESEQRLAAIFRLCRDAGRMILLLDEIEALARHRHDSHEASARLVSILLAEMDGLTGASDVLLIGSANALSTMDRAVLDRFDTRIEFTLPGLEQRRATLSYYARHLAEADVDELAVRTEGWNFRRLARFAEAVVRGFVAGLDLTQLEAREPPLPRLDDYLRELAVSPTL